MTTDNHAEGVLTAYQLHLFEGLPLYTTRLVREAEFSFPDRVQVRGPEDVAAFLRTYFIDKDREEFIAVFLDTANTVIGMAQISVGGLSASIVEPQQVFKAAILGNAAALVLAHQHPSGNLEPSREDRHLTQQLAEAGEVMGIPVHDHLIIGDHGYASLAERGLIDP